jgi:hypothetical protein
MSTACAIPSGARSASSRRRSRLESDARTDGITLNSSFPPSAPSVAVGVIPTLGFAPSVAVGVIPAAAVGIAVAGVEGASVVASMDVEGASVVVSMGAAAEDGVASCALW